MTSRASASLDARDDGGDADCRGPVRSAVPVRVQFRETVHFFHHARARAPTLRFPVLSARHGLIPAQRRRARRGFVAPHLAHFVLRRHDVRALVEARRQRRRDRGRTLREALARVRPRTLTDARAVRPAPRSAGVLLPERREPCRARFVLLGAVLGVARLPLPRAHFIALCTRRRAASLAVAAGASVAARPSARRARIDAPLAARLTVALAPLLARVPVRMAEISPRVRCRRRGARLAKKPVRSQIAGVRRHEAHRPVLAPLRQRDDHPGIGPRRWQLRRLLGLRHHLVPPGLHVRAAGARDAHPVLVPRRHPLLRARRDRECRDAQHAQQTPRNAERALHHRRQQPIISDPPGIQTLRAADCVVTNTFVLVALPRACVPRVRRRRRWTPRNTSAAARVG